MNKVLRNSIAAVLLLVTAFASRAQQDSLPYSLYGDKIVLYSDLGFNTAPINLKYHFRDDIRHLRYRNNSNLVLGLGFSYKWFALRLGINLPVPLRSGRYGKTQYFDLGFDFTVRKLFFDVDYHLYQGYALKNAWRWNDSIDGKRPHLLRPDINSASFSVNVWHFRSKDFKMQAMRGKTGSYDRDIESWYFKYTLNIHGMNTDGNQPIVPYELHDSLESKTLSHGITALDFGVVPGYAYIKRWKQFQIGAMAGLGVVIQSKFYSYPEQTRGFLGLAPRFDFKFIAGYNRPKYFLMLLTDFDNKSIRFNNFRYGQTYYQLKIVGGIRLDKKKKKTN
jgi:hypothetical protein